MFLINIILSDEAIEDIRVMDKGLKQRFQAHFLKLTRMPPRRHLRFGLPFNVEEVGPARFVYDIQGEDLTVARCFATHKEYERWYKSFR